MQRVCTGTRVIKIAVCSEGLRFGDLKKNWAPWMHSEIQKLYQIFALLCQKMFRLLQRLSQFRESRVWTLGPFSWENKFVKTSLNINSLKIHSVNIKKVSVLIEFKLKELWSYPWLFFRHFKSFPRLEY